MSTGLLNIFLLIIFTTVRASEAANKFNKEDLNGFAELVQKGNGNIGNLTPLTQSLNLPDLNLMAQALKPLEDKSRSKRQTENEGQLSDEMKEDDPIKSTQLEIDAVSKTIQLPLGKKGNPAFSINAKTVYILYPSLFQDPNIFGRFSIPQNINMDKNTVATETTNPVGNVQSRKPDIQIAQIKTHQQPPPPPPPPQYPPTQQYQHKGRRSADPLPSKEVEPSSKTDDLQKRNVESHLSGTIVVQNQDVNEYNRRDSY